ncbi:MAG: ABC transporter permease [Actinomycetota bacterium]|nr:ABC transporter permease [Actinomycetota bacterium]
MTTTVAPTTAPTTRAVEAGERRNPFRQFVSDRLAASGLAIVLLLTLAAIFAPAIAPHDPTVIDPLRSLEGSSRDHLLGTDELGRDVLSRLLVGARWSLGIAALATLSVMLVGTLIGLVSGYIGGWVDGVVMRVVDSLLALPSLLLYLAIVGTLGPGIRNVFIALVAISWATYARVMRGLVLSVRERAFVRASRSLGAGDGRLMLRHILPNVISPIVVLGTLQLGGTILALAALGFFGLGAQPPTPEWGTMINQGRLFLETNPGLMVYPGIAISLAVLGFNLMGDGLRDVLDPQLAHRGH